MTHRRRPARLAPAGIALIVGVALSACTTPMPAEPPSAPSTVQPVPATPPLPAPAPVPMPAVAMPGPPPGAATTPSGGSQVQSGDDQPVLAGSVIRVVDGDTLKVQLSSGPITVRLASVDAPEHDQPVGTEAASALTRRLDGRQVELQIEAQDQYDRLVAFVYLGGENINAWLVQQGYAWAYRQYMTDPRYCVWEADARTYRRGLWSAAPGTQRAPWEWRKAQREGRAFAFTDYQRETVSNCVRAMRKGTESRTPPGAQAPQSAMNPVVALPPAGGACRIKGNISESGKIYHVPGSEWYERTQIDTRKGERWFCTEAEARAAGWRAPR